MTGGAEALKAALVRSAWLIIGLMVINAVALSVMMQLRGPRYEATARVVLSPTNLAAAVSGIQPPYVDPERADEAESALASSTDLYEQAAEASGGRFPDGGDLQSVVDVDGGNRILFFSATTRDEETSVGAVNAVASAYPAWRRQLYGSEIDSAIRQLRRSLARSENDELREQLNRLEILKTLTSGEAILVEEALGASKTTPRPFRDAVLGLVLGLFVGLLLAGAREAFDMRVRSEGEIEDTLGVPVIAAVQGHPRRTRLVMFGRHEQEFGDAYDLMAVNLVQAGGTTPTLLAVTSSVASEGKTTTASNLAVALARRGLNVIVVDADVRRPSIAETFRLPARASGLVEVLREEKRLNETLHTISLDGSRPRADSSLYTASGNGRTSVPLSDGSLRILPAGESALDRRVIHSRRLHDLLADLKAQADIVILDTAPALLTAEMAELAPHVDLVLIVVRQGRVTVRALRSLRRQAENWPATVVGAVVTDADTEEGYGYHRNR
jgi:Mrp family chromosome partitioning ATPase